MRRVGRPPKKSEPGGFTTLTIRIPSEVKNSLIDVASGFDLSMTELIVMWLEREMASGEDRQAQ